MEVGSFRGKFFPLRVDIFFGRVITSREASKKSQKLLPFVEMAKKHVGAQKEITSQTDWYLVILSSKTYVFEDKMTKC